MARSKYDSYTDEELVEMFRNSHDSLYMGELYLRYTHLVFGVCLKYLQNQSDAQDATMQIFEKLIKDLKKTQVKTFKPWLYTVAKNYCMMEFRKAGTHMAKVVEMKKDFSANMENQSETHLDEYDDKEKMLQQLEHGMEGLNHEQQVCIKMFYQEDKSYKQIAEQTGYTVNEVKSYIQNGKRNLKNYLTKG